MERSQIRLITVPGRAGTQGNQSPGAGRWEAGGGPWPSGRPTGSRRRGRGAWGGEARRGEAKQEVAGVVAVGLGTKGGKRGGGEGEAGLREQGGEGRRAGAQEAVSALLAAGRGRPACRRPPPARLRGWPRPLRRRRSPLPRKAERAASAAFAFSSRCTLRVSCGARPPAPAMATLRVQPEAQAKVSAAGSRTGPLGRRGSERLQASCPAPAPVAGRGRGRWEPR